MDVWGYTPRVIAGFMNLAFERRKTELAEQLSTNSLASQGTGKQIDEQMKKLTD